MNDERTQKRIEQIESWIRSRYPNGTARIREGQILQLSSTCLDYWDNALQFEKRKPSITIEFSTLDELFLKLPEFVRVHCPAQWRPTKLPSNIDPDEILQSCEHDTYGAWCLNCGEFAGEMEPDTHGLHCDECHQPAVYGAEEICVCYPQLVF